MRDEWIARLNRFDVAEVAKSRQEHHRERMAFWSTKKEEAMTALKQHGLSINETMVEEMLKQRSYGVSATNTMGADGTPRVTIDQKMMADVQETARRVAYHREKVYEYTTWRRFLEVPGDPNVELDHNDWLFFYGHTVSGNVDAENA